MIDSHCHVNCLTGNLDELIKNSQQAGVEFILCPGIEPKYFSDILAITQQYPHIKAGLGVHPNEVTEHNITGEALFDYANNPNVIAIGPGLGQSAWSEQMIQRVFWEAEKRDVAVIMDADALNLLTTLKLSAKLPKKLILTPHPGEAARLLNTEPSAIESDRFGAASKIQKKFGP